MQKINLSTWKRRTHFAFFSEFEEPYFGTTWAVDMTQAKQLAKAQGISLFIYYLHKSLEAAMAIENFKYRITAENEVILLDTISASATIMRANETFGFSYIPYDEDIHAFAKAVQEEITRIQNNPNELFPPINTNDVMHCSAIPWLDFTAITHSRIFKAKDSVPKISYGQITENNGKWSMPVALFVHHGLIDGLHVSRFKNKFQSLLDG